MSLHTKTHQNPSIKPVFSSVLVMIRVITQSLSYAKGLKRVRFDYRNRKP